MNTHGNASISYILCKGLLLGRMYRCEDENREVKWENTVLRKDRKQLEGREFAGNALMHAGIPVPMELGEYGTMRLYFKISGGCAIEA